MRRSAFALALLAALRVVACTPEAPAQAPIGVADALGQAPADGFARALAPRRFVFPADHGPHPDYRNEWWYLTGNLADETGHRYGFQITFFRVGLARISHQDSSRGVRGALGCKARDRPGAQAYSTVRRAPAPSATQQARADRAPQQESGEKCGLEAHPPPRVSRWAASQVWMAHAALSDLDGGRHLAAERFSRDALDLAGARTEPFRVWLEDWSLSASDSSFPWHLHADAGSFALDLDLSALRAPVLQGHNGLSRKSAQPGNATYYYSITRLDTRGQVRVDGAQRRVSGLAWLDREWGTSALGPDQVGWDWMALQLDDGADFMYYRLRRADGSSAPESAGMLVGRNGSLRRLAPSDVVLKPMRFWRAPDGTSYPVAWSVLVRPLSRRWRVEAALDDQLMSLGVSYWEGAVRVLEPASGKLIGRGYLELTGYRAPHPGKGSHEWH